MPSYRRGLFWRLPVDLFGLYLRMNIDLLNPEFLLHKKTVQCPTLDRTHHATSLNPGEHTVCEQKEITESYPQE